MWASRQCVAQLSRACAPRTAVGSEQLLSTTRRSIAPRTTRLLAPTVGALQVRTAAGKSSSSKKNSTKAGTPSSKKAKAARTDFITYDLKLADQFALLDAMRYIRAFEVGQDWKSVKYEVALKLKTVKNGPVVRNFIRLPVTITKPTRICVICPADSKHAQEALAAGAAAVGEEEIFAAIREGRIEYDTYLCQTDSLNKLNKAGLGRVLGPKGLMPSAKAKTVVPNPASAIRDQMGASQYRERLGVIRMAIGQMDFTPEELQKNIKAFVDAVKKDMSLLSDKVHKDVAEVVLSATHSPGFTLNGLFRSPESTVTPEEMARV